MAITGNKGEWSEIYTHLKLLAEGELYSGDKNLKKISDLFFPILQIIRKEKHHSQPNVYEIDKNKKKILLKGNNNEITISQEDIGRMARILLKDIKRSKPTKGKEKFSFEEVEAFMNELDMHDLKAKSSDKRDIRMMIHDFRTDVTPIMGFSIKSKLGGKSTLVNANHDGTNFLFCIKGGITDEQIDFLNNMSATPKDRKKGFFKKWFDKIDEWGYTVEYEKMLNDVFFNNLRYVDSHFHRFLADCILTYYGHKTDNKLSDIVNYVSVKDPCNIMSNNTDAVEWYKFAMKQFLVIYALGMTANKPWNRKYDANGGYIIVKENGEIVCYHFYDRNQLEDYLYYNTAFDTPSTSRHDMYKIWRDGNGEVYLKLSPQIRFIHDK